MIRSIEFMGEPYRKRVLLPRLEFAPGINVLAGPNGCGKSTVLRCLGGRARARARGKKQVADAERGMVIDTDAGPIGWYDFERDNVRTKSSFGENVFFEVAARFASHGEVVRSVLSSLGHDDGLTEDYVFLLDEPDQALDFAGVRDLIVVLWEMKPGQIIVAAHHPLVLFERKFNVVEMAPGFLAGVRKSLTAALGDGGVDV